MDNGVCIICLHVRKLDNNNMRPMTAFSAAVRIALVRASSRTVYVDRPFRGFAPIQTYVSGNFSIVPGFRNPYPTCNVRANLQFLQ